jgi:cytoskeleton protein RodZ
MSEATRPLQDGAPHGVESGSAMSAGSMLRRAREDAGLHIGALAVSLKVPVKKLEALEADRLDLLPDTVFARALAGTVCRLLKVDPAPVLAAFPQTSAQRDQQERTGRQPTFKPSGHSTQKSLAEKLSRPLILLGFAFAMGALGLMFFPAIQQLVEDIRRGAESSGAPAAAPPLSQTTATGNGVTEVAMSNAPSAAAANPVVSAAVVSAVASEPVPTSTSAASDTTEILTLTARGNSWVEVTDAKRVLVLRKTMLSGESQNLGGALPMAVIVGRANLVDVQVRGSVVDLAPVTKDNVARFEVK